MKQYFLYPIIIFNLIIVPLSNGQAGQISFSHISVEDGLSQSTVHSIMQDQTGYLWFATQDGLNKYDGYNFEIFRHDPADSNSISHNWIWDVLEDHENNIWVATWNGLNRYDPLTNTFVRYSPDAGNPRSVGGERTNYLFQDSQNRLWIGIWAVGLNRYVYKKDQFIQFTTDSTDENSLNSKYIRCIFEDSKKNIWIGTWGGGLNKLSPDSESFLAFVHDPKDVKSISSNFITSIEEDKDGTLIIGTFDSGVNRFDTQKNKVIQCYKQNKRPGNISDNNITKIMRDDRDRLWIGTQHGGLNLYDRNYDSFINFMNEIHDPNSLEGQNISSIFQDRSGILWFGATGLNRFDPKLNQFTHINHLTFKKNNLNSNIVRCFWQDGKNTWVGTEGGGINIYSSDQEGFTLIKYDPYNNNSLSSDNVRSITKDENDNFWIATLGGGLNKYNPLHRHIKRYYRNNKYPEIAGISEIETLYYDSQNILWIGTASDGLFTYDKKFDLFEKVAAPFLDTLSNTDQYINTITEDSRGIIWIGHWGGGLSALYPNQKFRIRFHYDAHKNSLSNDIVHSIHEDSNGAIWVGTAGGLDRFLPSEKAHEYETVIFESFHIKDGLPNEVIYGITEDNSGNLWLSTNNGLSKFNPLERSFKNFTIDDGLQGNEFNTGASLKDLSGNVYFGGNNGFNIFHPDSIIQNNHVPSIVITSFKIFDRFVNLAAVGESMELSYDENFISIDFAALDYTAPYKNQYAYKMEGLDQKWQFSGNRRFANYTNLDPGQYVFKVKGSNNDGVWNEAGVSMQLYIHPPFWQTWWFMVIVIGTISALLYALHKYRIRQLLEVEKLRLRIASDLHDDVGSSLTKISLYSDLIREETNPAENRKMLERISHTSRGLVKTMSDIVWAIDARRDSMGDLIDRMKEINFSAMDLQNIKIQFKTKNINPDKIITASVRQNVYLLFKEAINNIVKHARANTIKISLQIHGSYMRLSIHDDGYGMDVNQNNGHGNGLKNMQLRADRISGQLRFINESGLKITLDQVKV